MSKLLSVTIQTRLVLKSKEEAKFTLVQEFLYASLGQCLQAQEEENDEGERENHCYCEGYRPFQVETGEYLQFEILSLFGEETGLSAEFKIQRVTIGKINYVDINREMCKL